MKSSHNPATDRPTVVCLCGSTRFKDEFVAANLRETLAGNIVLTIGCDLRTDAEIFGHMTPEELEETKKGLDELHFRKIEMADEVLILNKGGYIGNSTRNELNHAKKLRKKIRYLEEPPHEWVEFSVDAEDFGMIASIANSYPWFQEPAKVYLKNKETGEYYNVVTHEKRP